MRAIIVEASEKLDPSEAREGLEARVGIEPIRVLQTL